MKKILIIISAITIGLFSNFGLHTQKISADWNYITLHPYYALPEQTTTVQGAGFSPGEIVTVNVAGTSKTVTVSGDGTFTSNAFTIPFSAANSKTTVIASGNAGHTSTAELTVGTFYPVARPSSYYVVPGGTVSFSGEHFSPNEKVNILQNGNVVTNTTANGDGSFSTSAVQVPNSSGDVVYTAVGQTSNTSFPMTVHVSGTQAVVVLDNYYGYSGLTTNITGSFFGSNETVRLTFGGQNAGSIQANSEGQFTKAITVPSFPASSVQTITATGQTTGKTASAQFTIAWNNNTESTRLNSGTTISIVTVDRPKTNIASGTSITVAPTIIATGSDAQNVSVQVLLSDPFGQIRAQQTTSNTTLIQNTPMSFSLTTPPLMPNTYTIGTIVNNSDNSILTQFSNLGTIVVQ